MQSPRSTGAVLAEGRDLFLRGLASAFPWVLAAELVQALPFLRLSGSLLNMDLEKLAQPVYLAKAVACGLLQAFLYGMAILRLVRLAGGTAAVSPLAALRAVPSVCIGYLAYEIVIIIGLLIAVLFFSIGLTLMGPMPALLIACLPLAPTAVASTALAFFIYPAVLERMGPFAALQRSRQLAMQGWARATLVVSVPALVLLGVWLGENAGAVKAAYEHSLQQLAAASDEGMGDPIQAALSSGGLQDAATTHPWLHLAWAAVGALAWWYTLAVCYAEYRELKRRSTS